MVRLGSVTGLPVVCGGRILGRVEQSILTPSGKSLRGMVIRKGMGGAKWLENDQIWLLVVFLCWHGDLRESCPRMRIFR